MTWIYLSILSALGFAGMNLISRIVSLDNKHPRTLAVAINIIAISLASLIWAFTSNLNTLTLPKNISPYIFLAIAIFCYGFYERLRFRVSAAVEVSMLGVINTFAVVTAFVIALFLYSESITFFKILGFCLVLIALILVSWEKFGKVNSKGILLALFADLLIGIAWALDKIGTINFGSNTYNLIVWVLPFFVLLYPGVKFGELKNEFKLYWKKLILIAIFNVVSFYLNLRALSMAEATKVMPIIQTATIFTVMSGIIFLKEKENIGRKLLAAVLAFVGVYFLL